LWVRLRCAQRPRCPRGGLIETVLGLGAVVFLIAVNALFVAAEFALIALDPSKLEVQAEKQPRRARMVQALLDRFGFHLAGAQLGITVSSLILGFIAQDALGSVIELIPGLERSGTMGAIVALVLATILQMVFGELVPKNLAIAQPNSVAMTLAPIQRVYAMVAAPIISLFDGVANLLVRRLGIEPTESLHPGRSRDDIAHLIVSSGESGSLEAGESVLLRRSIRFGEKDAADVLVPRPDMVILDLGGSIADLRAESSRTGHSRFPVCGEDLDDIKGVVDVRDIFTIEPGERWAKPISTIVRDVLVVPESRELPELLADMNQSRSRIAIVVDEHGGTAGLVTLEDLFEELVGDIADEYDIAAPVTATLRAGAYDVDASLHSDELLDAVGVEIPDGPYETLAGFVLSEFGRLPSVGESVESGGWVYTVELMDRRRISRVAMRPLPPVEADTES